MGRREAGCGARRSMTTKAETVAEILRLHSTGMSMGKIAKQLGVSKSTVGDVIKRHKSDGSAPDARSRAIEEPSESSENRPSESDGPYRPRFTAKMTEAELDTFLKITKAGYLDAHRQKDIPYDKRVWCEVQYVKMYRDAIKLAAAFCGIANGVPEAVPVSPLDELAKAIESYREDE